MDDPKKRDAPTWRPLHHDRRDMDSGIYPVSEGHFEPLAMPRQSVRAKGASVAPLRARLRRR